MAVPCLIETKNHKEYSLAFQCNLVRTRSGSDKIHNRWTLKAREELENVKKCHLDEWLSLTMRDAFYVQEKEKKAFSVSEVKVILDPHQEKGYFSLDAHSKINGVLKWKSDEIDNLYIQTAVNWRLGQLFSHYNGIGGKKWAMMFTPLLLC